MYKEIKLGDKVIGVFKDSTPVSLTDEGYLQWKGVPEVKEVKEVVKEPALNSQSKKSRKKKD